MSKETYDWREHWEEKTVEGDTVLFVSEPFMQIRHCLIIDTYSRALAVNTDLSGNRSNGALLIPRVREPEYVPFESIDEVPVEWWSGWLQSKESDVWKSMSHFGWNPSDKMQLATRFHNQRFAPHPGAPAVPFGKRKVK